MKLSVLARVRRQDARQRKPPSNTIDHSNCLKIAGTGQCRCWHAGYWSGRNKGLRDGLTQKVLNPDMLKYLQKKLGTRQKTRG